MSRLLLRLRGPLQPRFYSSFSRGPAPPRLPADQQAEFERLQRAASVSSAFQEYAQPQDVSSSSSSSSGSASTSSETSTAKATGEPPKPATPTPTISASDEETMHPNYVRGAPAEFEGDVNPRTGEVGGPKREPLRWGAGGDWSYNGRVTDF
ncbi:Succinate dehydrogenase assembly factor 4 [Colletotrichum spinosum]|uniref:Succinate dehydrogenase assembly factor 4, mitochondrial n=1 Tax=Colletotrichum spinosum TaxID=1347390 RepID=A0A4R8QTI6_9PEZI|nr:Succinate dehydrogenase assembly factor 4 [Colletotrichum spinosum]